MKYYINENNAFVGGWDMNPPPGLTEVPFPPADARQKWADEAWGPIPVAVPASITRGQGRLALLDAGLYPALEAAMTGIEDPEERLRASIQFERETWERSNPWVGQMGDAMGLTAEQIDQLFVAASIL